MYRILGIAPLRGDTGQILRESVASDAYEHRNNNKYE